MDAGVAIVIALSRAVESAGVARCEREIADVLASGAGFVGACYREEAIAHVSRSVVESANVPWNASQGDCAPRQSVRGRAARGSTSNAPTCVARSLVQSVVVPVDARPCFAYEEVPVPVFQTQHALSRSARCRVSRVMRLP